MSDPGNGPLPSTHKEWEKVAKKQKVIATSIHDLLDVASASKIGLGQYLSLRVLWEIKEDLPDATVFGFSKEDDTYVKAGAFLKSNPSWQSYLADLQPGPGTSSANKIRDIGAFSNVRYYQLHVDPDSIGIIRTADEAMDLVPSKFSPRRLRSAMPASTRPMTPSTSPL